MDEDTRSTPRPTLVFEIGPVEEFIGHSRRTRDLWVGSYLLSYFMARAIRAAEQAGATIRRPAIAENPLYRMVAGDLPSKIPRRQSSAEGIVSQPNAPEAKGDAAQAVPEPKDEDLARTVASLPDVFEAAVDAERAEEVARAATRAWWEAWWAAADAAWSYLAEKFPDPLLHEPTTGQWVWQTAGNTPDPDRQNVSNGRDALRNARKDAENAPIPDRRDVWNIRWTVIEPTDREQRAHARRGQFHPFEGLNEAVWNLGEKSTLDGRRTALRDFTDRPSAGEARQKVRSFWIKIGEMVGPYDVRANGRERLDAISCVKRFLPYVAEQGIGWGMQIGYASTRSVAVAPWLKRVLECEDDNFGLEVCVLAECVKPLLPHLRREDQTGASNSRTNPFLDQAARRHPVAQQQQVPVDCLIRCDGDIFFPEEPGNYEGFQDQSNAERLRERVRTVIRCAEHLGCRRPSDYFVLLTADGDRMSQFIREHPDREAEISDAVARFSHAVAGIVERHLGQPVYAGGDELLAFLPCETALDALADLHKVWTDRMGALNRLASSDQRSQATKNNMFTDQMNGSEYLAPTISGALLYAHADTPLSVLVHRIHELLDEEAKNERDGRDAFAVEVWTNNGPKLTFARHWEVVVESGRTDVIADILKVRSWITEGRLSSRAVFKLRPILEAAAGQQLRIENIVKLLFAENLSGAARERQAAPLDEHEVRVLVNLLARPDGGLDWSVARFIRFLAEEH